MWAVWTQLAYAYETDQLTWRDRLLEDAEDQALAVLQPALQQAVERTNHKTECSGDDATVRLQLAREIDRATGGAVWVGSRGLFRAPGFSRYSAALFRSDAARWDFRHREDLYGDMTLWQSVILTLAGPCPTYQIAGVRIGSDKLDHFFALGWQYFKDVQDGLSVDVAVARGAGTEVRFFGLLTSKTFSFADLKANWDGYRFYAGLLGPESVFQRDGGGCVDQVRDWDWDEWIDSGWDEVQNPSVHTHLVRRRLLRTLEERRDSICDERVRWDADGSREERMDHLNEPEPWIRGTVPLRSDPYQLASLCDPGRQDALETPRRHRFVQR